MKLLAALLALAALPAAALPAAAQTMPAPAAPAQAALTLAQALAGVPPPKDEMFLTVGAERVMLPLGAVPPQKGDSASQIGQAYGRIVRDFGGLTALAPPEMTLLNTQPGTPDPYDGVPPKDALKMLLASLSDGQWKALTGATGLGVSDLTGDAQRALLAAFLPSGDITAHLLRGAGDAGGPGGDVTLTARDLQAVRLRLGQQVQIGLPVEGKPNTTLVSGDYSATGKPQYITYEGGGGAAKDRLYGAVVRQTVPNVVKPSDLDFDRTALTSPVPLGGVKTVGDLLQRIGATLKIEIYADRRYEKRSVILVGPATARARDLLRGVAFCVCGTYRRVGPAYVLTDDLLGLAPRRRILTRFAEEAAMARSRMMAEAGDRLVTVRGGVDGLPALAEGLGFSGAQKALAAQADQGQAPGQGVSLTVPLAKLTPEQQALARWQIQQWNDSYDARPHTPDDALGHVTLDGDFRLTSQAALLLLSPAVPGPVSMSLNGGDLFQPSSKLRDAFWQKQQQDREAAQKAHPAPAPPTARFQARPAPPALSALLARQPRQPRRAVVASPRTVPEVDALVASMKTVGLNHLWLDVFSEGHSHLDPDILTEALARTKGTGIVVFPTLDLLCWGKDAPAGAADLTSMGETSAQAAAWQQRYQGIVNQNMTPEEADKQPAPTDLSVFPFSDAVQATLTALVRRLAGTAGVGALVLRETVTPGYERPAGSHSGGGEDDLGYTAPLRLALLRKDHVDPLDLASDFGVEGVTLDTSLPEFEYDEAMQTVGPGTTGTVRSDWDALRSGADAAFLRGLLAAAQETAGHRMPFLVKQRRTIWQGGWYGLWDDPRRPLPELPEDKANGGGGPDTSYAAFAHTQCRTDLYELNVWEAQSKDGFAGALQQMKPGWDGFVLDYGGNPSLGSNPFPRSGDPLASLAESIAPSPAKAKPTAPNGPGL